MVYFTCSAKTSQCGPQRGTEGGGGGLAEAQGGRTWSGLARTLWEKRGALGGGAEGGGSVERASSQSTTRTTLLLRLLGRHGTKRTVGPTTQTTIGTTGGGSCCCNWWERQQNKWFHRLTVILTVKHNIEWIQFVWVPQRFFNKYIFVTFFFKITIIWIIFDININPNSSWYLCLN